MDTGKDEQVWNNASLYISHSRDGEYYNYIIIFTIKKLVAYCFCEKFCESVQDMYRFLNIMVCMSVKKFVNTLIQYVIFN